MKLIRIILIGVLLLIVYNLYTYHVEGFSGEDHKTPDPPKINNQPEKKCGAASKLLPVTNPLFNYREICKNCILLEDHLFQKGKRCNDCCKKHFLTLEALAEEAITLDNDNKYKMYYDLPDQIRDIAKMYIKSESPEKIAQKLRKIRKDLIDKCFDVII